MQQHIQNITIHKFRGLQELTLSNLGQINLLVGVNNSGKTSVLEAISTYCRPLDPLEWLNTAKRREIKYTNQPIFDALKWLFPQQIDADKTDFYEGEIYISGDGRFPLRESRTIYREITGIGEPSAIQKDWEDNLNNNNEDNIYDSSFNNIKKGIELNMEVNFFNSQINLFNQEPIQELSEKFLFWENERFINKKPKTNIALSVDTVTPFTHRIEQLQIQLLSDAIFQRFKPEVIKLLQMLDEEIIDLQILIRPHIRSILYIDHKKLGLVPLSAFGDGIRRLLFIALTLAKIKPGVLLIDELETAIHTEALGNSFSWLIQWCQNMNVQLFATTHSLEAVDAMLNATKSEIDLVLYRLEQKESQTKAIRLDRNRLQRLREDLGMEVR